MCRLSLVSIFLLGTVLNGALADDDLYTELKDMLQLGGVNTSSNDRSARNIPLSDNNSLDGFLKSNEFIMDGPLESTITFDARSFDDDVFNLKLNFGSSDEVSRRKKAKIRRVLTPILVIVLLKAITLIPLALGVLGIKTWNALQLSFVSFVTSLVVAVWKLCQKFSHHHDVPHVVHEAVHDVHVPHVYHDHHDHFDHHHDHHLSHHDHFGHHSHHDPWDLPYHRSDETPQEMAYSAYAPETKA